MGRAGLGEGIVSDEGRDVFGPYCDLTLGGNRQRLRWIGPGGFAMGSPEVEPGRFANEGPRHEVRLTQGFWLFDTACSQSLWRFVVGTEPSRFRGDDLPVEQVSWWDAQAFLAALGRLAQGLAFDLPTEAQWEYACRAGSTGAYAFGDSILASDARILRDDAVAWDEPPQGTGTIDRFRPNSWGIFQMHGNVWEWCRDGLRRYSSGAVEDPVGPEASGAHRVVRGGSWGCDARHVRSAYRAQYPPENRNGHLGLRCICIGLAPETKPRAAHPIRPPLGDRA